VSLVDSPLFVPPSLSLSLSLSLARALVSLPLLPLSGSLGIIIPGQDPLPPRPPPPHRIPPSLPSPPRAGRRPARALSGCRGREKFPKFFFPSAWRCSQRPITTVALPARPRIDACLSSSHLLRSRSLRVAIDGARSCCYTVSLARPCDLPLPAICPAPSLPRGVCGVASSRRKLAGRRRPRCRGGTLLVVASSLGPIWIMLSTRRSTHGPHPSHPPIQTHLLPYVQMHNTCTDTYRRCRIQHRTATPLSLAPTPAQSTTLVKLIPTAHPGSHAHGDPLAG
jgi:hypothetical protein